MWQPLPYNLDSDSNSAMSSDMAMESDTATASDSSMAWSKHRFTWVVEPVGELETKLFTLRVFDLDLVCVASLLKVTRSTFSSPTKASPSRRKLFYELKWADSENKHLLYRGQVDVYDNQSDTHVGCNKTATPDGHFVLSSSLVSPKGEISLSERTQSVKAKFSFDFTKPTVNCDFGSVFGEPAIGRTSMSAAELAMSLLKQKVLTDVVVVCEDKTFHCHKIMLAAHSEVFKRMLTVPFKEAHEGKIELKGFDPEVVRIFSEFIYSNDVAEAAVTWELFEFANMYEISGLQSQCLQVLVKNLTVENCCRMLEATFVHDLSEVFRKTVRFIRRNKSEVAKTEGWAAVTKNPDLVSKIFEFAL